LERLARAERIDGVIAPGSDRPLAIAARIAHKLGVPHPLSPETAATASARQRERERFATAGVPQTEAVLCRTLDEIEAAAEAIGVAAGPVTARVAIGEDGPRIVRLAPRLGGGHDAELCRVALGVDLNMLAVRGALGEPVRADDLEPGRQAGGACIRFLLAPPGELRAVTGLEDAYGLDGIRGIRVYRRPGHVFGEVRKPADRAGAVLAVGG